MAVAVVCFLVGIVGVLGADLLWAVALGDRILHTRTIPEGVPFAAAPSPGWPNPLVVGECVLSLVHRVGLGGLLGLQILGAGFALVCLGAGARREGASDSATAVTLLLVVVGALGAFFVTRIQVFSLLLFPITLLLLRADSRYPSRRIWGLIPLVALWANLHGGVLVGVGISAIYLGLKRIRLRPLSTLAVGLTMLLAPALTPARFDYARYTFGVMTNAAAQRREQMWGAPSLDQPLDILMLAAIAASLALFARRRREVWEYVAVGVLVLGTVATARTGLWLLMLLVAPAASSSVRPWVPDLIRVPSGAAAVVVGLAALAGVEFALDRGPAVVTAYSPAAATTGSRLAARGVVLAEEPLAEQLAVDGARIWLGNPLDAFGKSDQAAYLDFVDGRPRGNSALKNVEVVAVRRGGRAAELVATNRVFHLSAESDGWDFYRRGEP